MSNYATIPVLKKTKERVDKRASKGETYDEIINDLLDETEDVLRKGVSK